MERVNVEFARTTELQSFSNMDRWEIVRERTLWIIYREIEIFQAVGPPANLHQHSNL